jgi:3-hydroxyisobutyrate dehydrogenase
MSNNIGVVGLGAMGSGMAASLRRAGYSVHVFDVRAEAAQAFAADGGVACAHGAEVSTPRRPKRCCSVKTALPQP